MNIYTTKEAAKIFHCCERTIRNKCISGEIKAFKIGNRWRITENKLINFVEQGSTGTSSAQANYDKLAEQR